MTDRIQALIDLALEEDIGTGDITTEALFEGTSVEKIAVITAKEPLVVAGLEIARRVFLTVDRSAQWKSLAAEGQQVTLGERIAEVSGPIGTLLKGERTALNFLQHLSGIATFTRMFVEKVREFPVQILDTRKTTPGLRAMEKHAVRSGGGKNHRLGLYDRFLIKDNHLRGIGLAEAIRRAKEKNPNRVPIEVEIDNCSEINEAIASGADILLLDNFTPKELKKAVSLIAGRAKTEASGSIRLDNIVDYAKSGVDFISIGALTHSAPAVDISMNLT